MENKDWQDLIVLYEVIKRIKAIEDIPAKDYTEEIQQTLKGLKDVRAELVQQLENQGIEDIEQQDSLKELVSRIEEIEGGGGECPDYSSFFEYVEEFDSSANILKSRRGEGMYGDFPVFPNLKVVKNDAFRESNFTGEFPVLENLQVIDSFAFRNSKFTGEFPVLENLREVDGAAFYESKFTGEFPVLENLQVIIGGAFRYSNFTGEFPVLENLQEVKYQAFYDSNFTGEFPVLENIREIGDAVFRESNFTGEFPVLGNLQEIGREVFRGSKFTGKFPVLDKLQKIGNDAFFYSNFTGEFPVLGNIQEIGGYAFLDSNFTGEFPVLDKLQKIGRRAFRDSNFDKDGDGFVVNYPGWDGESEWNKPETYRLAIKDQQLPEFKTIYTPGGKMEVLDPEYQQGLIEKHKEEVGEPSDLEYWKEYAAKLKEIGFERDEYGNYVDVVNDKSVIIVPDDIKFQV